MLADHAAKRGKRYRYYASQKSEDCREKLLRVPAGDLEAIVLAHLCQRRMAEESVDCQAHGSPRKSILNAVEKVIVDPASVEACFKHADIFGLRTIRVEAKLARRGKEMKFIEPPINSAITSRDPSLMKLVVKAHLARECLEKANDLSISELAEAQGVSSDYFRVLLRISYLAPDIVAAILEGRQPVQLNRQRLARATSLPIDWHDQRGALGFS
jgi:site-specific DNA recombinase